jgi:hypothetical protein
MKVYGLLRAIRTMASIRVPPRGLNSDAHPYLVN